MGSWQRNVEVLSGKLKDEYAATVMLTMDLNLHR
jgi:hypothetical protein